MSDISTPPDVHMNAEAMSREEIFTDGVLGSIRKLIPVTADGEEDASRNVQYFGTTQIMTPAGALPINFEIPAASLSEAIAGFGKAAKETAMQTMEELREMQRQQASSIVVPGAGGQTDGFGGGGIKIP